jgi:hypothetical protein
MSYQDTINALQRQAAQAEIERLRLVADREAIVALIQRLFDEAVRAVDEAEFTPGEFDLVDHKRLLGELLDAVKQPR